jgi:hypothetical protein
LTAFCAEHTKANGRNSSVRKADGCRETDDAGRLSLWIPLAGHDPKPFGVFD